MKHLEDEYNKRFSKHQWSNDDFDVEGLWNDVEEALDEPSDKGGAFWFKGMLLGGLLFLSIAGGIWFLSDSGELERNGDTTSEIVSNNTTKEILQKENIKRAAESILRKDESQNTSIDLVNQKLENQQGENRKLSLEKSNGRNFIENTSKKSETISKVKDILDTTAPIIDELKNEISVSEIPANVNGEMVLAETIKEAVKDEISVGEMPANVADEMVLAETIEEAVKDEMSVNEIPANVEGKMVLAETIEEAVKDEMKGDEKDGILLKNGPDETDQSDDKKEEREALLQESNGRFIIDKLPPIKNNTVVVAKQKNDLRKKKFKPFNPIKSSAAKMDWQVGFFAGINNANLNFIPDPNEQTILGDLKEQTEKGYWGSTYGIHVSAYARKSWMMKTGFELNDLWTKFDYTKVSTTPILKEDFLLKVWLDETQMDTLQTLYGDTLIDAIVTREVIHFNQYRQFSIPVLFGFYKKLDKLNLGMSAGPVLNFTTKQSGRSLDGQSEIAFFEQSDSSAPMNSFGIALRIEPTIGYHLTDNFSVNLYPQWTWQKHAAFDGTNVKTSMHQLNMNLGIGWSF